MSGSRPPARCPACGAGHWSRQQLAEHLVAWACDTCRGQWLSLADYRDWRLRHPDALVDVEPSPLVTDEAPTARVCAGCGRIMSRHRTGTAPDFHVDRCAGCQAVWLDDGEWSRLTAADLHRHLDRLLSATWQQKLIASDLAARRMADLRRRLGDEVFEETLRLRTWLDQQPNRDDVLRLLLGDAASSAH